MKKEIYLTIILLKLLPVVVSACLLDRYRGGNDLCISGLQKTKSNFTPCGANKLYCQIYFIYDQSLCLKKRFKPNNLKVKLQEQIS